MLLLVLELKLDLGVVRLEPRGRLPGSYNVNVAQRRWASGQHWYSQRQLGLVFNVSSSAKLSDSLPLILIFSLSISLHHFSMLFCLCSVSPGVSKTR